ncbi:putative mucin TcMUCII [Trypanosoma cruzi]|uniref:Mucin TcMUCII, putative n=2 Tax=Trypanosoma cruzi TaxID=5693 RepID=Q4E1F7_TRYCC|nr:mucin TcMUCII, putative [Trypanosoma cruzi]EAN98619.1 mucin TcMUCII, putative [Trypanosoma cruzi]PWV11285.1 putative mucin TcMUCII [Trypanosoma cruzi]|eukprot:XP_820470.1 mucin TcMUCII [Trypanosoma cruzi strain CL Brener]
MTTCRLLCALLVLALCCCRPSVCAAATGGDQGGSKEVKIPTPSPRVPEEVKVVETEQKLGTSGKPGEGSQSIVDQTPGTTTDTEQPLNQVITPHTEEGAPATAGERLTTNSEQAATGDTETAQKTEERTLKPEVADNSDVQELTGRIPQMKVSGIENTAKNKITTTTTTTKAPTTTATTTTEAPTTTTTTTRAPSLLREVDGSLSSSAWVCAPLVLAVSALAYTTLG